MTSSIRTVFERFAELGSARRVWLWFRSEGLSFPLQSNHLSEIRWVAPTYTAIHHVLTNPVYAGAYTYGKTRREPYVDAEGVVKKRTRHLPRSQWSVLIPEHHAGFIDWATYEANQARLGTNTRPKPHQGGGAVREGTALLQGLATCGHCGRRLRIHYRGRNANPGYHWASTSSTAAAPTASTSVAYKSMKRSRMPFSRPCSRRAFKRPFSPPKHWKPITMPHLRSGAWR